MEIRPIMSAMRRNKVGAIVIAVQMAITLAIMCNALFIIQQRLAYSHRPTGADEANVFAITNQWVGTPPDLAARGKTDVALLRGLPGVIDATASNSYVMGDSGSNEGITLKPDQKEPSGNAAEYYGDDHFLQSSGLKLSGGRNFNVDELSDKKAYNDGVVAAQAMITRVLAEKLFPGKNAVGQIFYLPPDTVPKQVVGVIDRLQVPWTDTWTATFTDNSIVMPFRYASEYSYYIVRVKPGQIRAVMKAAEKVLMDANRARVLVKNIALDDARIEAYKDDHGLAVILGVVCAALVAVTAFGIVGLTSYWVAQRRRQIGIRRALGATKNAIVRYFQTENFLIAAGGAALGVAMAVSLNLWMVTAFQMQRLNIGYALIGAVVVLLLGQASVLWPALKAASIPPALATRAA
jgi:putative ABC transport system permease protein